MSYLGGIRLENIKIQKLNERTLLILEKTKKEQEKYKIEREKLFKYLINKNNIKEWEKYIIEVEKLISCNSDSEYDK